MVTGICAEASLSRVLHQSIALIFVALPILAVGCGGEGTADPRGIRIEGTEPGDCQDDADNDADGFFDCADPGCSGSSVCIDEGAGGAGGTGGSSGAGGTGGSAGNVGAGGAAGSSGIGGTAGAAGVGGTAGTGGLEGTGGSGGVVLTCDSLIDPPADCGNPCTSDSECTASFCDSGECVANCTAEEGCGDNETCNARGRCIRDISVGTGGAGGSNECQSVTITPTRSIPNVMFLVDQSGSMTSGFGGGENRWEAANTVINGIVASTDSIVRYGLTTYTSDNGNDNPPCPRLPTQIDFALGNATNIANDSLYPYSYPPEAGADTPTSDSIDSTVAAIQSSPPPNEGPTIIVLATDGVPDSCELPDPSNTTESTQARDEAVVAAGASHDAGIDLFVLWIGTLTDNGVRAHIQEVANEGIGLPRDGSSGDAEFWVGTDPASLENEFREIIGASISCDIQMDKRFDNKEQACNDPESDVRLNGERIPCSDTDGWRVKPGVDDMIELVGTACYIFKSGGSDVTFSAEFPCGAIVVD